MNKYRFPAFAGLKAFYAVASAGSAVKAAEHLGISASSISHQLKALERELGVRLFENRKGKLHLTADGEQYFIAIEEPMARIQEATEDICSVPGRRRVSLTLTPSFAASWLMPRMRQLTKDHPELELNLITTTRVVDLGRENIDLAIRRRAVEQKGCVAEPFLNETIVPVLSPDLWESQSTRDLGTALLVAKALVNTTLRDEWDEWSAARGIPPPPNKQRFNLETYELTIQAARDGLGIALGREPLINGFLDSGELVAPFSDCGVETVAYFLVHRDEPMPSDVRRLYEWLRALR